ncbi:Do family serine endopeptidase [Daejeonella oryzae]|uniref:Do family serine endopeptidase n=1 Tax=Daejeonella oryzae TaxID=1122943 RepID=UPI000410CFE7|nr:Do family serine endopeptidase [Daejeonella oryzae]
MWKFCVLILLSSISLTGCNGLNDKKDLIGGDQNFVSFQAKQQQALKNKNGQPSQKPTIETFNFRYAAKKATPGVVHIKSVFTYNAEQEIPDFFKDFFGSDEYLRRYFSPENRIPNKQMGSASGVIVSSDGYIVTNNHVVNDSESIEIVLHDQRNYKAKIIGTDPSTDLALLKISERNLDFIEFGNSDSVEVGDVVLAVGNPFNLASTVTAGIVSAKARNINILTDQSAVESYIQTDAAVNRGNSGGALVDIYGKLVGINAAIATPTGSYAGYSFAIPVEIVKKTIDDLMKYGRVMRGYLGIIISDLDGEKAAVMGLKITKGVIVENLYKNSAALQAGVQKNDVIIKIDNRPVETSPQLREIIARHRPGDKLQLTLIREGKEKIIPIILKSEAESISSIDTKSAILNKLGIEIQNISEREKSELELSGGVKVVHISKGVIQKYTNIKQGFIIIRVNGKKVANEAEFTAMLENKKGGILIEGIYPGFSGAYYYAFSL